MFFDQNLIDSSVYVPTTFTATTTFTGTTTVYGFNPTAIGNGIYVASTTGMSTFTVPSGVKKLFVQLVGGGGNGGGSSAGSGFAGSGGGSGGYSQEYIDVSGTSSIVYYVGAATEETRFGPSSAVYLRATGGTTAANDSPQGGAPGVGSGGDLNLNGNGGEAGGLVNGVGASGPGSYFGGGASSIPKSGSSCQNGQNGSHGAGGGGSSNDDSGTSCPSGGAGGTGLIIISW
jgi:hypothetical protein